MERVGFKGCFSFHTFLFFKFFKLKLMSPFIGVCHVGYRFEIRSDYCGLKICIKVSWLGFYSTILLSISFGIELRIFFFYILIGCFMKSFGQRSRFEVLILGESLLESLILDLKQFSIWVNVLIFQCSQCINFSKIVFLKLTSLCWICENTSWTRLRFAALVLWIWLILTNYVVWFCKRHHLPQLL